MNHRELLVKYIANVIEAEGVSFIAKTYIKEYSNFTEKELKELQVLEKEARSIIKLYPK